MDKKDIMRVLLFPEYVKNKRKVYEEDDVVIDYDKRYNNALMDLTIYVMYLENKGYTTEEIIDKIYNYNEVNFNSLEETTKSRLKESAVKLIRK